MQDTPNLIELLQELGPCLSSRIASELQKRFALKPAAARKRVERRPATVRTLDLNFPKGAVFLYLAEQWQSELFWSALGTAIEQSNGAYARAIWALRARGGIVPVTLFAAASANSAVAGQLGSDVVKSRLVEVGLLKEIFLPSVGLCVGFASAVDSEESVVQMRSRLLTEQVLIKSTMEWARRLGLGSWNAFEIRGNLQPPQVARFEWDLAAPSYLSPLAPWNAAAAKPDNGFVVFDVVLSYLDERSVKPLVYKLETMRRMKRLRRCLQFVVADHYSPEALDLLRKNGIVAATSESLFGKDVAEALRLLISTLTQAAKASVDIDKFQQLFDTLSKVEGAAGTLRGALFEFVCADLARSSLGAQKVVMNRLYRRDGKDIAEVDVRAECGKDILFIESKGLLPGNLVPDADVFDWLNRRVAAVYMDTVNNSEFTGRRCVFELWTTGELSADAKAAIDQRRAEMRGSRYRLNVRYGAELVAMAKEAGNATVEKVLRQHFIAHPLSLLEGTAAVLATRRQRERAIPFTSNEDSGLPALSQLGAPESSA